MAEDRKTECTVRDGKFVEPCHMLDEFIVAHAAYAVRGSGLFHQVLHNLTTREQSRSMVGYKTPQHKRGMLINFCPWCGKQIDAPFAEQRLPGESPTA